MESSSHVYGIDPWKQAIDRIQLKIKIKNLTNVPIIRGKAEAMPFDKNFFNLIVSNNVINNVKDPKAALSECYRVSHHKVQMVITVNLPATMMGF